MYIVCVNVTFDIPQGSPSRLDVVFCRTLYFHVHKVPRFSGTKSSSNCINSPSGIQSSGGGAGQPSCKTRTYNMSREACHTSMTISLPMAGHRRPFALPRPSPAARRTIEPSCPIYMCSLCRGRLHTPAAWLPTPVGVLLSLRFSSPPVQEVFQVDACLRVLASSAKKTPNVSLTY